MIMELFIKDLNNATLKEISEKYQEMAEEIAIETNGNIFVTSFIIKSDNTAAVSGIGAPPQIIKMAEKIIKLLTKDVSDENERLLLKLLIESLAKKLKNQ